jgi:hypothetical protein
MRCHQFHGPFEEEAGRLAVSVPYDAPTEWVRRLPDDPRLRQRGRVQPGRVEVEGIQADRTGVDPVDRPTVRRSLPEV